MPVAAEKPRMSVGARLLLFFGSLAALGAGGFALIMIFGLPALGIEGIYAQEYQRAILAVESLANKERDVIERWFDERRRALRILAQDESIPVAINATGAQLAHETLRMTRQLRELRNSMHDAYDTLLITDPAGQVLFSPNAAKPDLKAWQEHLSEARQPGMSEFVSIVNSPKGPDVLVTHQIVGRDRNGNPDGQLLGLLASTMSLMSPLRMESNTTRPVLGDNGGILLIDWNGKILAASGDADREDFEVVGEAANSGSEGVKLLSVPSGSKVIAAYRHLHLGAADGLSLVVIHGTREALTAARSSIARIVLLTAALFVLSLLLILFAARQLARAENRILELNRDLEQRVENRTRALAETNEQLTATLNRLEQAQGELVRSEKLASLGSMVAGVAHELNTPIGNALLVATSLDDKTREFREKATSGLTRTALEQQIRDSTEGMEMLSTNLYRAAELISSFKQLSVDQISSQRRKFSLLSVCNEVSLALMPTLKKLSHSLEIEVPEEMVLDSFPGAISQILANLINNALNHAFDGMSAGTMQITAENRTNGMIELRFSDNGCGMPPEVLRHVFDPFFTTKLGKGGSGLGMHIVYSIVSQQLGGKIEAQSTPGQGTCWIIQLPLSAPQSEQADTAENSLVSA